MARTGRWRALALGTAALVALIPAACGAKDNPAADGPVGNGQLGGAPTTTPAAGATSTKGAATPSATGNSAPTYPKDAKTYALELARAWSNKNFDRINQLATQTAVGQIRDSINGNGTPNGQWTGIGCGPDPNKPAEQTQCVLRNAHGDESVVKLTTAQIGFPTAVVEAPLNRTMYPSDPVQYAQSVLQAFSEGNTQRVVRLSNTGVKGKLSCVFGHTASIEPIDTTYSKVTLNGQGGSDFGKRYVFRVLTKPGGKAGAVKEVLEAVC